MLLFFSHALVRAGRGVEAGAKEGVVTPHTQECRLSSAICPFSRSRAILARVDIPRERRRRKQAHKLRGRAFAESVHAERGPIDTPPVSEKAKREHARREKAGI